MSNLFCAADGEYIARESAITMTKQDGILIVSPVIKRYIEQADKLSTLKVRNIFALSRAKQSGGIGNMLGNFTPIGNTARPNTLQF